MVYEGVDLAWIDRLSPSELPTLVNRPIVGIVAHLSGEKGHENLIRAAASLRGEFPDALYAIVGEGALKDQLVEMVESLDLKDQFVFTGFRHDSEALMKTFDVFCLPSLSEGLSSAILSAMACSLPVIATSVGGIPELVIEGKTGFLVPPNDSDNLAEALKRVLESPKLRSQLGEAGRLRVEKYFTIRRKIERTASLYQILLGVRPSDKIQRKSL